MMNKAMVIREDGAPIKPSGEILTRKEFIEVVGEASQFYGTVTDEQIENHNYQTLYRLYKSLGESDSEVRERLSKGVI